MRSATAWRNQRSAAEVERSTCWMRSRPSIGGPNSMTTISGSSAASRSSVSAQRTGSRSERSGVPTFGMLGVTAALPYSTFTSGSHTARASSVSDGAHSTSTRRPVVPSVIDSRNVSVGSVIGSSCTTEPTGTRNWSSMKSFWSPSVSR